MKEKLESNISELEKIVKETPFNSELALEFLEAVKSDFEDIEDDYKDQISTLEDKVEDLEDSQPDEDGEETDSEIDCGIGVIKYIDPDNLLLQQIMEALDKRINETSPKVVLQFLS